MSYQFSPYELQQEPQPQPYEPSFPLQTTMVLYCAAEAYVHIIYIIYIIQRVVVASAAAVVVVVVGFGFYSLVGKEVLG